MFQTTPLKRSRDFFPLSLRQEPVSARRARPAEARDLITLAREAMITRMGDLLAHWALDEGAEEADFQGDPKVQESLNLYPDDVAELLRRRGEILEVAEAFL